MSKQTIQATMLEKYQKEDCRVLKEQYAKIPSSRRQKELDAIYDQDPWTRALLGVSTAMGMFTVQ
jgi:hypothetical protein